MHTVGTVAYLNAAPLTSHLDPARYEVVADHPRGIADALVSGTVDVALVPVAAVLDAGDLALVPGVCVGADGPVASVVIAAEAEPEAWTTLLLDRSSRTSITLARLLVGHGPLASRVRADLEIREVPPHTAPGLLGGTVAAVVIGDPARALPNHLLRWDLAELWKRWTGLPFVFAVWAARDGLPEEVRRDLREAGTTGVAAIPHRHAGADLHYLTRNLRYALDEPALMGLRRFAALAHRAGLVRTDLVRFLDPLPARRARRVDPDAILADAADGRRPTAEEADALLDAPLADLAAAADARRQVLHGRRATYALVADVPADAVDAALAGALASGASAIRPAAPTVATVAAARTLGLDVAGVPADSPDLARLAAAGLRVVTWDGRADLAAARRLGLAVHAHLNLPADGAGLVEALLAARAAGPLLAVTLHLALPEGSLVEPGRASTTTWLRATALARLLLDVRHVTASPVTQGVELSGVALAWGADDLGAVGVPEHDVPARAAKWGLDPDEAERVLRTAGFEPERRDAAFAVVGGALTRARKVRPVEARA